MEVCEVHGIELDKDSWICAVCNIDRCKECEYIDCIVDGRKKDYGCSFNCKFCQGRAGLDHLLKCGICGAEGCSNCLQFSSLDLQYVCPDCGSICSVCGKAAGNFHLNKCDMCPINVCSDCGIRICQFCGKHVCHQHSFKCYQCGKWTCKECMGGIEVIGCEKLCKECAYSCPNCGSVVNKEGARICEKCKVNICEKCGRECEICGRSFCKIHIFRCNICNGYVCEFHSDICPACGGHSCNNHFFKCEMCEIGYCEKCRPHKQENLCNLCDNLIPLKEEKARKFLKVLMNEEAGLRGLVNWDYSVGREIYIFYGKSVFSNYLVVGDKKTGKVLKINRIGLMDKVKKMFS